MYLSPRRRREFGIVWTRGRDPKGNLCWRSPRAVKMTITRERATVWSYAWVVRDGSTAFFRTSRLRRAFKVAANHVVLRRLEVTG